MNATIFVVVVDFVVLVLVPVFHMLAGTDYTLVVYRPVVTLGRLLRSVQIVNCFPPPLY